MIHLVIELVKNLLEAGYALNRNERIMKLVVVCTKCKKELYEIRNISREDLPLSEQQLDKYAEIGFQRSKDCSNHPNAEKVLLVSDGGGIHIKDAL